MTQASLLGRVEEQGLSVDCARQACEPNATIGVMNTRREWDHFLVFCIFALLIVGARHVTLASGLISPTRRLSIARNFGLTRFRWTEPSVGWGGQPDLAGSGT